MQIFPRKISDNTYYKFKSTGLPLSKASFELFWVLNNLHNSVELVVYIKSQVFLVFLIYRKIAMFFPNKSFIIMSQISSISLLKL